jgi:starvation-inducible DNA-binding protein
MWRISVSAPRVRAGYVVLVGRDVAAVEDPMSIDIGISDDDRRHIADGLSRLLADSFVLYLETHGFHWNVTGPQFQALHTLFMQQYTEQWNALDLIAERIRSLGFPAPASFDAYRELASIRPVEGSPDANGMVRGLLAAQEACARTAREAFRRANAADDQPTAGLCAGRMEIHEKAAWMLRSMLP